ncbi:hypothetical protein IFM89_013654 [Coptis chinensis]|uniref:PPM-type phosphatase domain-containing protein n=1 Tax=Coptis chinensis TaxID=261450 RepID=A0A835IPT3_9MAGN|nr:hypothetical protein IFM89_013654 [Coptis chinensis]
MLAKKVESTITKAMDVETKKMRLEVAAMEKKVASIRVEKDDEKRAIRLGSLKRPTNSSHLLPVRGKYRPPRMKLSKEAIALSPKLKTKMAKQPDRPDEMEGVEAAGGRVINWNGYRVLGMLATSRSIEISVTEHTEKDEFVILASDGLWDAMSNEMACQVVRRCLNSQIGRTFANSTKGSDAAEAAVLAK